MRGDTGGEHTILVLHWGVKALARRTGRLRHNLLSALEVYPRALSSRLIGTGGLQHCITLQ